MKQAPVQLNSRMPFLLCRVGAILAFSLIGITFPELGPNRFWFAGYCALFVAPLSFLIELYFPVHRHAWSQPLFDAIGCSIAVQIIPQAWAAIFMVGLLTANTRLIVPAKFSFRYIALAHVIVISGMLVAAIRHDVDGWLIPMLTVMSTMPAVLFYAQREAERTLKEREHLARLDSVAFISRGVAHDFNNALTGVSVNAALAKVELTPQHPAYEMIESVLDASNYAARLTRQLMDLSGQQPSESDPACDVVFEVQALIRLLKNVIPESIDIALEVVGDIPSPKVDRTKLQQVVMNLLLNAVEAVESPSTVRVDLSQSDGHVVMEIIDNGHGIPKSELAKIFEPFYSSKSNGNGIGLSTARHIVESAGGMITVDTAVGSGTRMSVRFPIDEGLHSENTKRLSA